MKPGQQSDITLVLCPPWGVINPPMGLGYLATHLRHQGFTAEIRDLNIELFRLSTRSRRKLWKIENDHLWRDEDHVARIFNEAEDHLRDLANSVLASPAPYIGFSIVDPNEIFTSLLIKLIRKEDPQRVLIAGGPGCSSSQQRESLFHQSGRAIDYFVVGEGEHALPRLLNALQKSEATDGIPGIVPAKRSFELLAPLRPADIDSLIFPTYEEFDLSAYGRESIALMWSRGCIGNCLYCKEKALWGKYRFRPLASIMDELHYHCRVHNFNNFVLYDSAVNGNPKMLHAVCDAIISSPLDVTWSAEAIAISSLSKRLLRNMRTAGCHSLVFGIESGSDHVLSLMHKAFRIQTAEGVLMNAHRAGIKVAINILVGFPGEHEKEFRETLDFLKRNQPYIDRLDSVSTLQLVHDTPLEQRAAEFGMTLPASNANSHWSTDDGNTMEVRRERASRVRELATELGFEIGRTLTDGKPPRAPLSYFTRIENLLARFGRRSTTERAPATSNPRGLIRRRLKRYLGEKGVAHELSELEGPVLEGVQHGKQAFIGPSIVHIDLTNLCNLDCIACWDRSPRTRSLSTAENLGRSLDKQLVFSLIDDLYDLGGVRQIKLGGGGEPTIHPQFADILQHIKSKPWNIELDLNTNFTRVGEELARLLVESNLDSITVSLWAGTPEIYAATHPNQGESAFSQLVANLHLLDRIRDGGRPRIVIHNVLMSLNCRDVENMVSTGLDIGADEINFVLMDPVPGHTDDLLLSDDDKRDLRLSLNKLLKKTDPFGVYEEGQSGRRIRVPNLHELARRIRPTRPSDRTYQDDIVDTIPCYVGWLYTRVLADGSVIPCCKGHRLRLGNLHKNSFREIWHSKFYGRFRHQALTLPRNAPYFSIMGSPSAGKGGCAGCDNLMHNLDFHRKILARSELRDWLGFELKNLASWIRMQWNQRERKN